jgi:hypothetical protein
LEGRVEGWIGGPEFHEITGSADALVLTSITSSNPANFIKQSPKSFNPSQTLGFSTSRKSKDEI